MFRTAQIEFANFIIRPLQGNEKDLHTVENGYLELFTNQLILKYQPTKEIKHSNNIMGRIMGTVYGYKNNTCFNHFIFDRNTDKMIGLIEILSPKGILDISYGHTFLKEYPEVLPFINNLYLIEYYLLPEFWGKGTMSKIIKVFINRIMEKTSDCVGAICHKDNVRSLRILKNLDFFQVTKIETDYDLYIITNDL